jgi:hypothetical protein
VVVAVEDFLLPKIKELAEKWVKTNEHESLYFEY